MAKLQPKLIVLAGPSRGDRYVLAPDMPTEIGRTPDNDVCLPADGVSRKHCRIYCDQDRWYVEDLGSTNGILVNDVRVTGAQEIDDTDMVTLGPFKLQFLLEPVQQELQRAPAAPAIAPPQRAPDPTVTPAAATAMQPSPAPAPGPARVAQAHPPASPRKPLSTRAVMVIVGGVTIFLVGTLLLALPRSQGGATEPGKDGNGPDPPVQLSIEANRLLDSCVQTAILCEFISAAAGRQPPDVTMAADSLIQVKTGAKTDAKARAFRLAASWQAAVQWVDGLPTLRDGLAGMELVALESFSIGNKELASQTRLWRNEAGWQYETPDQHGQIRRRQ